MKIRIDYHFHPNLPKNEDKANKKCEKILDQFCKKKINTVIVTEHAYKNPKRAFNLLKKQSSKSLFCFPGIECVTKEGIDIIVFSKNEKIYEYEELKEFKLSYLNLIEFIKTKHDLYAFVTHPHTLGLTSVINKLGTNAYHKSVNQLNAVEISNGAFDNLFFLTKLFPFKLLLKSRLESIKKTKTLPTSEYPKTINFLAAGSDAHHIEDIGNYYEITTKALDLNEEDVFKILTTNKGKGKVYFDNSKSFSLSLLIKTGLTALNEFIMKKTK